MLFYVYEHSLPRREVERVSHLDCDSASVRPCVCGADSETITHGTWSASELPRRSVTDTPLSPARCRGQRLPHRHAWRVLHLDEDEREVAPPVPAFAGMAGEYPSSSRMRESCAWFS